MPIIVHIDMNSFFASCEVKKDPSLKGKKVIISGKSSRSIVTAASYEAKKEGIYTTMPYYLAKDKCPDATFLSGDYSYYTKVSEEIFSYLRNTYPLLEIASIDECYIDMSNVKISNPVEYFTKLQKDIYEKLHIPCSIGVSYNRFLAKMGSDYKKPLGITIIRKKDVPTIIWPLPISAMYGIGKATSKKLIELNIKTIGDFANSDSYEVKKILGKYYEESHNNANGIGTAGIILERGHIKSVGHSHTLDYDTDDYEIIKENLKYLCFLVSNRLKEAKMLGYTISVVMKDSNFISYNKSKKIIIPTDDSDRIFIEALKLLDTFNNMVIRLVGVSVSDLIFYSEFYEQLDFYKLEKYKSDKNLNLIEQLNKIAGENIFIRASDLLKGDKK